MLAAASSFLAGLLAELLRNVVADWRRDTALKAAGAAEAANVALGKASKDDWGRAASSK